MEHFQLHVNRDLLDPKFEGYKVSMENTYVYSKALQQNLCKRTPSKSMVGLQQLKVFSGSNNLFRDLTRSTNQTTENLYRILDTGHIQMLVYDKLTKNWKTSIVGDIDVGEHEDSAFPVNLLFTERNIVVTCNGISTITVFLVVSSSNWVKMLDEKVLEDKGLALIEARVFKNELVILALSISGSQGNAFSKIHCITVGLQDLDFVENLKIQKQEVFIQRGHFETCTFGNDETIIFLSSKKPQLASEDIYDEYQWTQEGNTIKATFNLNEEISKEDIDLNITDAEVLLSVKGRTVLSGCFFEEIEGNRVELCSDPKANTLSLTVHAKEFKKWTYLVTERSEEGWEEKKRGEAQKETFGADNAAEECDEAESSLFFYWIDENTGHITKQCDVSGSQVLFVLRDCLSSATVCLRHNVDGLLLSLNESPPLHLATLQAFGYVQASKLNRVWSGSSPDSKYACIVENNNRVLLYSQKVEINGTLSNRKTSTTLNHVSKQYLLRIECPDPVLGVQLTNSHLFAVTKDQVHVTQLPGFC